MISSTTPVGADATPSYPLLHLVLKGVIGRIESHTVFVGPARTPLDEQVRALARGWQPTRSWARAVQAALYLADQLVVPLRPSESIQLEIADRTHAPDFHRVEARIRRPGHPPVHVLYHFDGVTGVYPVALYQLYVMPGGARDILLASGRGPLPPFTKFYVPDLSRSSGRLSTRSLQLMLTRCLRSAAPAIGVSEGELQRLGMGRLSNVRRAVARHLIDHRGVEETARILGLQPLTVVKHYRGELEEAADLDRALRRTTRWRRRRGP